MRVPEHYPTRSTGASTRPRLTPPRRCAGVPTRQLWRPQGPGWYPARKSVLSWLVAQDPQLPPKNRHVGVDGQALLVYDPIFAAYQDIQKDVIVPELAPLWENTRTAA
jgi:hypothetical protein